MSAATINCDGTLDPIFNRSEVKTKFWGLTCETGLKYNQRVKKKYCVTQAVLDPDSYKKDDESKFVSVMVEHDEEEHIMAVLRHDDIYQVNLNMLFDRENVTFFLKGTGVVNLLGYEIIDPDFEASASFTSTPAKGVKTSKRLSGSSPKVSNLSNSKSPKSGKMSKSPKPVDDEDITKDNYMIKLLEMSDDDNDKDFSVEDVESEDSDIYEYIDSTPESDFEEEKNENEVEMEENADETEDEESEESSTPEPVQKRKKKCNDERTPKRSKMETSSSKSPKTVADTVALDESSSESSDATPIPTKEKRKKKKKKKQNASFQSDKAQQTMLPANEGFVSLEGGVEVKDLKIGHGPVAIKGKTLHVFYMGRLANKEIFDSVLPGRRPFSFPLGANKVIKGWEIGLEGMRAGGKRKVKVPPSMGYGNKYIEGIPANSTLYFTVELQAVG